MDSQTPEILKNINYNNLRLHPYFSSLKENDVDQIDHLSTIQLREAVKVPKLREYCIRAVGKSSLKAADLIARNGGLKPDIPWLQVIFLITSSLIMTIYNSFLQRFDLLKLSESDRLQVMNYLDRCDRLPPSGDIYRLFWTSTIDSRTIRVDTKVREYFGFYHSSQGHYEKDYFFVHMSNPCISPSEKILDSVEDASCPLTNSSTESEENLRSAISSINRLRPK